MVYWYSRQRPRLSLSSTLPFLYVVFFGVYPVTLYNRSLKFFLEALMATLGGGNLESMTLLCR